MWARSKEWRSQVRSLTPRNDRAIKRPQEEPEHDSRYSSYLYSSLAAASLESIHHCLAANSTSRALMPYAKRRNEISLDRGWIVIRHTFPAISLVESFVDRVTQDNSVFTLKLTRTSRTHTRLLYIFLKYKLYICICKCLKIYNKKLNCLTEC